jgi:hypothetical protein
LRSSGFTPLLFGFTPLLFGFMPLLFGCQPGCGLLGQLG